MLPGRSVARVATTALVGWTAHTGLARPSNDRHRLGAFCSRLGRAMCSRCNGIMHGVTLVFWGASTPRVLGGAIHYLVAT